MPKLLARRYDTLRPVQIEIVAGHIHSISPLPDAGHDLPVVAPGLIDLQINGFGGIEFNDPQLTPEKVRQVAFSQDPFGVTSFLATCTTDSHQVLAHSLSTIAATLAEELAVAQRICGIHLEGPFISPEEGPRGAHPLKHVRLPNWDEFQQLQEAARGQIKLLTVSAEYDESPAFIRRVVQSGVLVAIGHTKATSDQIKAAVDAGARMSTHLGNGAHPTIRRHPNYIWDQLADDRLTASLIADGHHLPAAVLKSMLRAKTLDRVVLVSDITSMGGMPPGRYQTGLGDLEVLPSGKLVPAGNPHILAGASFPLHVCVANIIRMAGVTLSEAIDMASIRPASLIHLPHPGLEVGAPANLSLFRWPMTEQQPLDVVQTIHGDEPLAA